MEGRAPDKKNAYFSSNVTWLLVIFVGIALLVVGLTICSDQSTFTNQTETSDTLKAVSTPDTSAEIPEISTPLTDFDSLDWVPIPTALQIASGKDKFLMIYFSSEECPPCRKMESVTFNDDFIRLRMKDFIIPVKIDPASGRSFRYAGRTISESKAADVFSIPGYPALLFYDGKSEKYLFIHPGYVSPDTLQLIFNYLDERIFEDNTISLSDYLELQTSNQ